MTSELKSFDRVAHVYDATRGFPPEIAPKVGAGLAALLPPGAHVLEVGIGTGRVAVPLSAHDVRITGIDISTAMVDVLRSKSRTIEVVLAEASRQPFRDGAFDAGLLVHILHLVPDAEATVRETIRAIRPGGVLLACSTSHDDNEAAAAHEVQRAIISDVVGPPPTGHALARTGESAFREEIERLGYEVEDVEIATWTETTSARTEIDELRRQVHSHMWRIPAERVPEIAGRWAPEAERIMGGLDRPVEATARFTARVVRL